MEKMTSLERLYQPDYGCIFGQQYANAFLFGEIDSLIWPVFQDIKSSDQLRNLLALKNSNRNRTFYHRNIKLEDLKGELNCAGIDIGLIQAMDLGRTYGISNQDVVNTVKQGKGYFKGILSYNPSENDNADEIISDINKKEKQIDVVGIALYPSFTKLNLTDETNSSLVDLLKFCLDRNYFIKIDIGNWQFPNNHAQFTTVDKLKNFFSRYSENRFIMSGLDPSGDLNLYYQLMKLHDNLWIEIDPRTMGGFNPLNFFKRIFKIPGFIQNCWSRLTIGSAAPTLEISQMRRGLLEATEQLTFSQRSILRTWAFRNLNRVNEIKFKQISEMKPEAFKLVRKIQKIQSYMKNDEIVVDYKITLRSFSITQLLSLTPIINELFQETLKDNPDYTDGEIFMRSYHTTTSLIINEHEYGNYLDLHFKFVDLTREDSANFMHTLSALENRADYNHPDHAIASTYGQRQLTLPIINRSLEIGSREHFYVLVTFGPRSINLFFRMKLIKI